MTSPSEAKLAATPPIVGLVSTEMNSPPAASNRAKAAETLAICISEKMPSCMRAPPPEPLTMISGKSLVVARSIGAGELFADDGPHAAHDERRVGDAERHAAGTDHAGADDGRVAQARSRFCSSLIRSRYGFLVGEAQRIGRLEVWRTIPRTCLRRATADALLGRNVPVVVALGADPHPLVGFFAEDGPLAAGAALPQTLGHTPLGVLDAGLTGLNVRFPGAQRHAPDCRGRGFWCA